MDYLWKQCFAYLLNHVLPLVLLEHAFTYLDQKLQNERATSLPTQDTLPTKRKKRKDLRAGGRTGYFW